MWSTSPSVLSPNWKMRLIYLTILFFVCIHQSMGDHRKFISDVIYRVSKVEPKSVKERDDLMELTRFLIKFMKNTRSYQHSATLRGLERRYQELENMDTSNLDESREIENDPPKRMNSIPSERWNDPGQRMQHSLFIFDMMRMYGRNRKQQ